MTVYVEGSFSNRAVYSTGCTLTMENITADASGAALDRVIYNNASTVTLYDVKATGSGAQNLYNKNSTVTVRRCTFNNVYLKDDLDITHIMQSSILSGVSFGGAGVITCVNSANGVDTPLPADCELP